MNKKIKTKLFILFSLWVVLIARPCLAEQVEIKEISAGKTIVKQYELFEVEVSIIAPYKNPHDPEQIDLSADFVTPGGKVVTVPAFFTGQNSLWKVRYAPQEAGKFSYSLILKTPSKTRKSGIYHFDVKSGDGDGFLRKSKNNPFYPVFDSGKPFFGVGHNIGWVTNNKVSAFEKYFLDLKKNGCNLTRIWLNNEHSLPIEIKKIGVYNYDNCAGVDFLLRLAKQYGIYVILVFDSYGSLMEDPGPWREESWKKNPYNKLNGGPCQKPWDFLTNEEAKKHYKNRLRYMVSRWGYSPHIMAFELWNELDIPRDWAIEMSSYIKSVNPHGQFVTTSLHYPWDNNFDESIIWSLKEIDVVQRHIYGNQERDIIRNLITVNREFSKKYNKLLLVAEFGMDSGKDDKLCDKAGSGVALHNSIWASALSRSFSSAMNWWWGYIRRKDLYPHYRALANFVRDVNWNSKNIEYAKTTPIKVETSAGKKASYNDVIIYTEDSWGKTDYKEFTVDGNGDILGGNVNRFLHGTSKKEIKIDPVFHVDYPVDGKFSIKIGTVSCGACLVVYLDGKEVLREVLPAGPGEGPWKKSMYLKKYDIYQCIYNTTITIDVPKGKHAIKLTNTGEDWIGIKKITLSNYLSGAFANARVTGLVLDNKEILLWIQNKDYNWQNSREGIEPRTISGASFSVQDVEDGAYSIEWWDTFKGSVTSRKKITAIDNALRITLPDFSRDLACKIKR